MSTSEDVSNLFRKFGGKAEDYQEIARENQAEESKARWPLLAALRVGDGVVAPAVADDHAAVQPAEVGTAPTLHVPLPQASEPVAASADAPADPPAGLSDTPLPTPQGVAAQAAASPLQPGPDAVAAELGQSVAAPAHPALDAAPGSAEQSQPLPAASAAATSATDLAPDAAPAPHRFSAPPARRPTAFGTIVPPARAAAIFAPSLPVSHARSTASPFSRQPTFAAAEPALPPSADAAQSGTRLLRRAGATPQPVPAAAAFDRLTGRGTAPRIAAGGPGRPAPRVDARQEERQQLRADAHQQPRTEARFAGLSAARAKAGARLRSESGLPAIPRSTRESNPVSSPVSSPASNPDMPLDTRSDTTRRAPRTAAASALSRLGTRATPLPASNAAPRGASLLGRLFEPAADGDDAAAGMPGTLEADAELSAAPAAAQPPSRELSSVFARLAGRPEPAPAPAGGSSLLKRLSRL